MRLASHTRAQLLYSTIALAGLVVSLVVSAQTDDSGSMPTGLQAQECARMARSGDTAAAAACQQKVMRKAGATMPEHKRRIQQHKQPQETAGDKLPHETAPDSRQAGDAGHQRALDCATLSSESTDASNDGYGYVFTSACNQPVSVHLCLADGPEQPSRKRNARLQPGESVRWSFAKRGDYEPMTVYDACFDPEQCKAQGSVACREP